MSYLTLCLLVLGVVVVAVAALALRGPRPRPGALILTVVVMLGLTVVFDNSMIAAGLVSYSASQLTGVRLGLVPVEDLAYPLAGALLLPALWTALTGIRNRADDAPRPAQEPR